MTQYQRRRAAGLCGDCGKVPALPGKSRCEACITKSRLRGVNRYNYLLERHRCTKCEKPLPEGWYYVECAECKAYMSEYTKLRKIKLQENGKCPTCGKQIPQGSQYKYCPECRQNRHKYYKPRTYTNAVRFKRLFGITATELWSLPEDQFTEWLNTAP